MRREVREYKVFEEKNFVIARIDDQKLEVTRPQLNQEVVLMEVPFIKTFVFDFLDELVVERRCLQDF